MPTVGLAPNHCRGRRKKSWQGNFWPKAKNGTPADHAKPRRVQEQAKEQAGVNHHEPGEWRELRPSLWSQAGINLVYEPPPIYSIFYNAGTASGTFRYDGSNWNSDLANTTNGSNNYPYPYQLVVRPTFYADNWGPVMSGTDLVWENWVNERYETQRRLEQTSPGYEEQMARQREEWVEQERQRQARFAEYRTRAAEADAKSRKLLEAHLDPQQREELTLRHRFFVNGSRGRRYCIRAQGQAGNVDWMTGSPGIGGGEIVGGSYCCHPSGVPDADAWLIQMLALMTDEDEFLRTANVASGSYPSDFERYPAGTIRLEGADPALVGAA